MGEIKSTLDLVMERTKHLSLSKEERERQAREEFEKRLGGLIQRFIDGALNLDAFNAQLNELKTETEISDPTGIAREIARRVSLAGENDKLLQLLESVSGIDTGGLRRVLDDYADTLEKESKQWAQEAKTLLATTRQVWGSAVVPNIESSPEWAEEKTRIQKGFAARLDLARSDLATC